MSDNRTEDYSLGISYSAIVIILVGIVAIIGIMFTVAIAIIDQSSNNESQISINTGELSEISNKYSYPYLYRTEGNFLIVSIAKNIVRNNTTTNYVFGNEIKIGSSGNKILHRDITDELLTTRIKQRYTEGDIVIPFVTGCPYITIEADIPTTIELSWVSFSEQGDMYIFMVNDTCGYVIFAPCDVTNLYRIIVVPEGITRIAYFSSFEELSIFTKYVNIYPIGCYRENTSLIWKTKSINESLPQELLMISLPHHNITNVDDILFIGNSVPFGFHRLITTTNNIWIIDNNSVIDGLESYVLTDNSMNIWEEEISYTSRLLRNLTNKRDKMISLNDLSILILFGVNSGKNIDTYLSILDNELKHLAKLKDVYLSGYFIFPFVVMSYINKGYLDNNREFLNSIMKTFINNVNCDLYFGYNDSKTPNDRSFGDNIYGYYCIYCLSLLLDNDQSNVLPLLNLQISSCREYFLKDRITERNSIKHSRTMYGDTSIDKDCSTLISIIGPITAITSLFRDMLKDIIMVTGEKISYKSLAYLMITLENNTAKELATNVSNKRLPIGITWCQVMYYLQ